ncbi:uncharacterized protein Z520_05976 [Fonsecaea multimorphosa CBS 102226]|uniref:AMP-dependent synthetase/ligase domain-containing protein n=1 Tax=Fonsecaea multimorphosa CBS 102226 TaxID=1442371 RepID=A0A0D2H9W1_9EURO|nr:uncharacterized protein Z520_05976 [Fonsecaea multimorphosa CBS 102226]KIX98675.1 hypothetical protein Z520_05976 [Fonsecaea multimorphosa CBS 102226]OAL24860.1 hypothetical protein AYO22_05649 [Fonsecaea multimorphosa]
MQLPDRTDLVPSHRGRNVLPNCPFFNKLLRLAHDAPSRTIISDVNLGVEKSRIQLLTDVLEIRNDLLDTLDKKSREDLAHGSGRVFIAVLAAGGYEYTVAVLGVLALGAVVVPISPQAPLEEAYYFLEKAQCVVVLTASNLEQQGTNLEQAIRSQRKKPDFRKILIAPSLRSWHYQPHDIISSSDRQLNDNAPGSVIFTSGTTGKPKGALHRRAMIHEVARSLADHYKVTEDDRILHLMPVHHATGAYLSFFPFLICGACIEFRSGPFSAEWTWDRWKKGGVSFFTGVPTMYVRMMRHFQQQQQQQQSRAVPSRLSAPPSSSPPTASLDPATAAAAATRIRGMLCGTSALPRPVEEFWETLRGGKRILTRYGSTESGAAFKMALEPGNTPSGSVGTCAPGVEVRFADGGDEGELLIKSPSMFMGYLSDEAATRAAHDAEGFYKTGDIARREGDYYFILGRASVDILKSGGYKISALDIERECLGLPYINEVMVVGVEDAEWGQRIAAAVSLRDDQTTYSCHPSGSGSGKALTLAQLRKDLSGKLARYKLPTILRVVDGELPKNATGKVSKKVSGPVLFPANYAEIPDVQVWSGSASSPERDARGLARL